MVYLIVGLGNPGKKYQLTRHNIGFLCVDLLSEYYNIEVKKKYKKSLIGTGNISKDNLILMKPLTFMNLSGSVIQSALAKFRIFPGHLIVIYDDIDIPLGKIKIKKRGSSAGHKGLQSILDYLQNGNFIRIRIGISSQNRKNIPAEQFVLRTFARREVKDIKESLKKIPEIVDTIINYSIEKAMNDYN